MFAVHGQICMSNICSETTGVVKLNGLYGLTPLGAVFGFYNGVSLMEGGNPEVTQVVGLYYFETTSRVWC